MTEKVIISTRSISSGGSGLKMRKFSEKRNVCSSLVSVSSDAELVIEWLTSSCARARNVFSSPPRSWEPIEMRSERGGSDEPQQERDGHRAADAQVRDGSAEATRPGATPRTHPR